MDKPTIPKGTRDFGPVQMAKRQLIFDVIRKVFQTYGFQPLETPTMENLSTLTGKYGDEGDQLLYKILNSGDFLKEVSQGDLDSKNIKRLTAGIAEKGLRYDLTVPFARYVAMNRHDITFPFKRYQIQPVWRADRPQKGRYREFYQCDADVVGTPSLLCEAEIILMIRDIFAQLGLHEYSIKINHRALLSGLARLAGSSENEMSLFVAIDKLDKVGEEKVKEELSENGFTSEHLAKLFVMLKCTGTIDEKIDLFGAELKGISIAEKGVADLKNILELLKLFGATEDHIEFDPALARGLSYYTGCIFEVKIGNVRIGSVSGGGRYDNLTGVFGLPGVSGVGISFGVDRLYDAMEELSLFPAETLASSKILVCHTDDESLRFGLRIAQSLRDNRIAAEIYPESSRLKKQLEYANKKAIPFALIIGSEEMASGQLALKKLSTGEQQMLSLQKIIETLL